MMEIYEVAIVGGGSAGLVAAITAARSGVKVGLFEKEDRVGKKLLATGNGRCNLTNIHTESNRYHGGDIDFQAYANGVHNAEDNRAFFRSLGVMTVAETNGKVFPLSYQAAAVLDMLREELHRLGVTVLTETTIEAIEAEGDGFLLRFSKGVCKAKKVIVAAGGMACPALGGSMNGYHLLSGLGHKVTELRPSLVKIKTENKLTNALKGIKIQGDLTLCRQGQTVATDGGEVLFTEYGISGPPVLQLSRWLCDEKAADFSIKINFLPDFGVDELFLILKERRELLSTLTLENFLTGLVNKKLGQLRIKEALRCKLSREAASLTDDELRDLVTALNSCELAITGTLGWKEAQATAGGAVTAAFSPATMESKRLPGLYAVGEVLDIDGDCGGYNLQWAWASGRLAAEAAVAAIEKEKA